MNQRTGVVASESVVVQELTTLLIAGMRMLTDTVSCRQHNIGGRIDLLYGCASCYGLEAEDGGIGIATEDQLGMDRCSSGNAEARVRDKHAGEGGALNCERIGALRDENPLCMRATLVKEKDL